jgi:hypothetical protein
VTHALTIGSADAMEGNAHFVLCPPNIVPAETLGGVHLSMVDQVLAAAGEADERSSAVVRVGASLGCTSSLRVGGLTGTVLLPDNVGCGIIRQDYGRAA